MGGDEKTGTGTGTGTDDSEDRGRGAGVGGRNTASGDVLFDHERLEVYRVAREFYVLATELLGRKMPQELKAQFNSAAMSILFNIGEGAGKTARADKQRSYEIAKGSTTEVATQLDVMQIRAMITDAEYRHARSLLVRVSQMLCRLCGSPRQVSRAT